VVLLTAQQTGTVQTRPSPDQNGRQSSSRKADHLRINLEEDVRSRVSAGFDDYTLQHVALPEMALMDVDTSTSLFGRKLAAPFIISSMTGGVAEAVPVITNLAIAARECGVALGIGSQRAAIEAPELRAYYEVRRHAPDVLLLANVGAVQLNYGFSADHCRRAVEMIGADGLILHLNPLQEALQPEGNTNFASLLARIEAVCRDLACPVVVKEVGWGISSEIARQLHDAGVAAIDVAGAGGTSWSQVEMHRGRSPSARRIAAAFAAWGIPTARAIHEARSALPAATLFGSGGISDGIDTALAIALGADIVGVARPLLAAASRSAEDATEALREYIDGLRITMFVSGCRDIASLAHTNRLLLNGSPVLNPRRAGVREAI
jgi:isopentenyl-diphosphate delta-isomerase